jgi:hypothetical protein
MLEGGIVGGGVVVEGGIVGGGVVVGSGIVGGGIVGGGVVGGTVNVGMVKPGGTVASGNVGMVKPGTVGGVWAPELGAYTPIAPAPTARSTAPRLIHTFIPTSRATIDDESGCILGTPRVGP